MKLLHSECMTVNFESTLTLGVVMKKTSITYPEKTQHDIYVQHTA